MTDIELATPSPSHDDEAPPQLAADFSQPSTPTKEDITERVGEDQVDHTGDEQPDPSASPEAALSPSHDPHEAADHSPPSPSREEEKVQEVGQEEVDHPSASPGQRRSSFAPDQTTIFDRFTNNYISYSIAGRLYRHIQPKSGQKDPELDVEAELSRNVVRSAQMAFDKKRRFQCISSWLYCLGVFLVLIYVVLPVPMVVIGVVGVGRCPFRASTLATYLSAAGLLLGLLVTIRIVASVMTCIRNRYCNTGSSASCACSCCIWIVEGLFYLGMVVNLVGLILGTYTTFAEPMPPVCPVSIDSILHCCDSFVYISSAFFTVFQYILYLFTGLFVCLVLPCVRYMDKGIDV